MDQRTDATDQRTDQKVAFSSRIAVTKNAYPIQLQFHRLLRSSNRELQLEFTTTTANSMDRRFMENLRSASHHRRLEVGNHSFQFNMNSTITKVDEFIDQPAIW